ncbi:MAG: TonB-dependent receptor [Candidatus Marinimicrobia bacterium]|nr:TonB-dependent receptor [Candidatus Neomarinimicrobiota bacterium]
MLIFVFFSLSAKAQQSGTISGFITDAESAEPLPYVNVILKNNQRGTTTDQRGYFVIQRVPPGNYTISVTYIGHKTLEREVNVTAGIDTRVDMTLVPENVALREVVVTADRTRFEKSVEVSRVSLSARELEVVPAFVEADVFRSIQMLPGVVAQNDFSAALVVRGGSPDENLILLDGVGVYNPYHFGGVFSAFNTDAIANADFQAGGFPVRYGGRLSSVLEIKSKEGSPAGGKMGKWWPYPETFDLSHGSVNVSLLSSKIFLEGPVKNGGWVFSGRRTYFDKIADGLHAIADTIPTLPYYFYDFQGKVHTQITDKHRLDINAYHGSDDLTLNLSTGGGERSRQEVGLNWVWGNTTRSAVLKSVIKPQLFAESAIAHSIYDFTVSLTQATIDTNGNRTQTDFDIHNRLSDWTFSERLDWKVNDSHRIQGGLEFKRLDFDFTFDQDGTRFLDDQSQPNIFSAYVQDTWSVGVLLNLQLGVRSSKYSASPRLWTDVRGGLKYRFLENTAFKFSTGTFTQFLFTSNSDDAVLRVVDFWLPVPDYLDPERAWHFISGIEHWVDNGNQVSFEVYYKPYLNILDSNPIQSTYNDKDDYIAGVGRAYGFETIWKRTAGRITGWLSYTYSLVEKEVDLDGDGVVEKATGEIYPPKYDKRHNFKAVVNYDLNEKNRLGLSWTASSGQPYTPVVGKMYGTDWFSPYLGESDISGKRNSALFPYYSRGDVSWSRKIGWFGWNGEFQFQVLNVLNRFNVLLYQWDHSVLPSEATATSMFPIMPTVGVTFTF